MIKHYLRPAFRKLRAAIQRSATRKLTYKPGRRLYVVTGEVPSGPVFVQFHGGGWVMGQPEDQLLWSQILARWGHASYAVEYATFANSGRTLDTAMQDAVDAMAYIQDLHPDAPIVLVGHSAGAPLAFWAAVQKPDRVAGMINFSGVSDLGPDGFNNIQIPREGRADASPIHKLHRLPIAADAPFLWAFHGGKDTTVPLEDAKAYVAAWKKAGSRVATLYSYPGQPHGFQNMGTQRAKVQTQVEAALVAAGLSKRPAFLDDT